MRRLRHLLGTLALGLFAMAAPFVLVGAVIVEQLSTENDTVWLLKVVCTVLMPFAAVLWYIVISYLRRRRAGYLMQLMVFFGTAFVMYALLALGVYSIRLWVGGSQFSEGPDFLTKNSHLAEEVKRTFIELDEIERELKKAARAIESAQELAIGYRSRLQQLCDSAVPRKTVMRVALSADAKTAIK
jgi:Kef-type K+ transport system membrane component KefB